MTRTNLPAENNEKQISPGRDSLVVRSGFIGRFIIEFMNGMKLSLYFAVPTLLLLVLSYFEILKSDNLLMILSVCLILSGLPLSAALRIDQLSLEMGSTFSREIILLIALLVSVLNFSLIVGVWRAIRRKN